MQSKIISSKGNLGETIVFRFGPGVELMEGLKAVCKEHGIESGVVSSCIGSLDGCKYLRPVLIPESKFGAGYGEPIVKKGPIELLSMTGLVCVLDNGEIAPHLHFTLSDSEGNAFGGHVTDDGNRCLITIEGSITKLEGVRNIRRYDEETGALLLKPE